MPLADSSCGLRVATIGPTRLDEAVAVLCDAFHDYPVMRYVLGSEGQYDERLRAMVGFFTASRFINDDLVMAATDGGIIVGVANITRPGERTHPAEFFERREALWRELGPETRDRYDAYARASQAVGVERPNYHLNMIGVAGSHRGTGIARLLLDAIHELSARDPVSTGVTLTTENPKNVALYQHFGYEIVGEARVSDVTTWGFFRPEQALGSGL
jgi:ribosomal protein S18 acetylase RimI-like enzyme